MEHFTFCKPCTGGHEHEAWEESPEPHCHCDVEVREHEVWTIIYTELVARGMEPQQAKLRTTAAVAYWREKWVVMRPGPSAPDLDKALDLPDNWLPDRMEF